MKIIITGASKGIGLEFCKVALTKKHEVLAVARSASESKDLQQLRKDFPKALSVLACDVGQEAAPSQIVEAIAHWDALDILINNAGLGDQPISRQSMLRIFEVNSIAPLLIAQACLPKLRKSTKPLVAQITSMMGSIADNESGGHYAYRASKSALNSLNKSLSIDQPWLTTILLHPGWVQTEMGGPGALISTETSVAGMWKLIEGADKAKTGQFFDYQGKNLPW